MAKKDRILEIMALAQLPTEAKIARLASRWVGKPFDRAQAKAVVKCYLEGEGRIPDLTHRLMVEKIRQESLRNERKALHDTLDLWKGSVIVGGSRAKVERAHRTMEIIQQTFGQHVKDNFNADALALMSLISGENRHYQIKWMDAAFRPARCALIEVVTLMANPGALSRSLNTRFLLYRTNGRVMVARTTARSLKEAWASQVSDDLAKSVPGMVEAGYKITNDLDDQLFRVVGPQGAEEMRIPWTGQTV